MEEKIKKFIQFIKKLFSFKVENFTKKELIELNNKSDIKLIEELSKKRLPQYRRDVIKAILDKRTKEETHHYNRRVCWLTQEISLLTGLIFFVAVFQVILTLVGIALAIKLK